MQEFLGLAYFAEMPAVIFNVQRARSLDRHAHAHPASRHLVLPPTHRMATPNMSLIFPRRSGGAF